MSTAQSSTHIAICLKEVCVCFCQDSIKPTRYHTSTEIIDVFVDETATFEVILVRGSKQRHLGGRV